MAKIVVNWCLLSDIFPRGDFSRKKEFRGFVDWRLCLASIHNMLVLVLLVLRLASIGGRESFCMESKSSPLTRVESEPMSRWFNFEKRSEGDLTLKYDRHYRFWWRCMGTLFECLPFWILVNLHNICSDKISGTFSPQGYAIFHISFSFEIAFCLQAISSSSCSSYLRIANLLIGSQLLGSRCGALKLPTRKIALFQHRRQPTGWARVREKTRK